MSAQVIDIRAARLAAIAHEINVARQKKGADAQVDDLLARAQVEFDALKTARAVRP